MSWPLNNPHQNSMYNNIMSIFIIVTNHVPIPILSLPVMNAINNFHTSQDYIIDHNTHDKYKPIYLMLVYV